MPVRLLPADDAAVAEARSRFERGTAAPTDLRLLTRHFLALLAAKSPGRAVEVRVPPYAVAQCVSGVRHTRGTPAAVVQTDPATWISLSLGLLGWPEALRSGRLTASGERSNLSGLLPLAGD